jgi:Protein of unknown function (DUF4012)
MRARHNGLPSGRRHRRVFRRGLFGLFLCVALWTAWCVHLGLSAKRHLEAARRQLSTISGPESLKAILDGDRTALRSAQHDLSRARQEVGSGWLTPAAMLPFIGRQVTSVRAMTVTAARIVDEANLASASLAPAARADMSRLELVRALRRDVARLADVVDRADLGPSTRLIAPLARARAELAAQVVKLREPVDRTNRAMPGLEQMLTGPTRLLLVAANNAQMGAGSGLPLAVATLDIKDGHMAVGAFTWSTYLNVPPGSVTLLPELASLWSFATPQDAINRAMISPRFPQTAALLADEYRAATQVSSDGVLMVDIIGLQKIVAAQGARRDPAALSADRIIPELMHDQYLVDDPTQPYNHRDREVRLAEVASSAISELLDERADTSSLLRALMDAFAGRHVLLWSNRPDQQASFEALGADGALQPDSLAVSLQNEASNKLDWFIRMKSTISFGPAPDGRRGVSVTVSISNQVPDGEPHYVAGPTQPRIAYGDYVGYLTLHVPNTATDLRMTDNAPVIVSGRDGPTGVIGRLVLVPRNTSASVTFTFTLPSSQSGFRVEPSARYPPIEWTAPGTTWPDERQRWISLG